MSQSMIDFNPPTPPPLPERFAAFLAFHRDNPNVFELFVRFAKEAAAARAKFGAHMIGERIRWYVNVETSSDDGLKLNDHHLPYYSRLAMGRHPELDGLFEVRDARFDTDVETLCRLAE